MSTVVIGASQGVLTASLDDIYTSPLNQRFVVRALTVTNTTAAAITLAVTIEASSGGTARTVIPGQVVRAGSAYLCPEAINHVLNSAGVIRASGAGLEYTLSGTLVA